ncbi:hypothetical protein D3C76_324870 [compost metagenome]
MLDTLGRAFALGDLDRHDLPCQPAPGLGGGRLVLAAQGESVLVFARNTELRGDILGGLGHRVDAVLRLHQFIDETPADGGVEQLGATAEGLL